LKYFTYHPATQLKQQSNVYPFNVDRRTSFRAGQRRVCAASARHQHAYC